MNCDHNSSNTESDYKLNCNIEVTQSAIGRIVKILINKFSANQNAYFSCEALVEEVLLGSPALLIIDGNEPLDYWSCLHGVISKVMKHERASALRVLLATGRTHMTASNPKAGTPRQPYGDFLESVNWFVTKKESNDRGIWRPCSDSGFPILNLKGVGRDVDAVLQSIIEAYYPVASSNIVPLNDYENNISTHTSAIDSDMEAAGQLDALNSEIYNLKSKNDELDKILTQTMTAHDNKEEECKKLRAEVDELKIKIAKLEKDLKSDKSSRKENRLQRENDDLKNKNELLRNENFDLRSSVTKFQTKTNTLTASLNDAYRRNEDNEEIIQRYEESSSNLRDDMETFRELRKAYTKRADSYLKLCIGVLKWLEKRHGDIDEMSSDGISSEFNFDDFFGYFDDLTLVVENSLAEFEKFEPTTGQQYMIDEHEIVDNLAEDSDRLFIKEVVSPGYKIDGKVIRKAKVYVCKIH